MNTVVPARIYGFLAPEVNQVVLLRRGPSAVSQMLAWDLSTNDVQPGQWMRAKVLLSECDVSPDERYVVVSLQDFSGWRRRKAPGEAYRWTVVSRPPFFSALSLWWGCWSGGGCWKGNRNPVISDDLELDPHRSTPAPFPVRKSPMRFMQSIDIPTLFRQKNGWREERHSQSAAPTNRLAAFLARGRSEGGGWEKPFAKGRLTSVLGDSTANACIYDQEGSLVKEVSSPVMAPFWCDATPSGELIFAMDGCLWRWPEFPIGEPRKVADLNDHTDERIAPPDWAKRW